MKKIVLAAVAVASLGMSGAAFAQAVPQHLVEQYGTQAFSDHHNDQSVQFLGKGTVFGRLFGHSESGQPTVDKTAGQNGAPSRGG
jgi:hypothetical protein